MKTNQWIGILSTVLAIGTAGPVVAEVGMMDGADPFKDFKSMKSRDEVRSELNSSRTLTAPASSGSSNENQNSGTYGVPGSRYSTRSPEGEKGDSGNPQKWHQRDVPGDIYFGG